MKRRTLRTFFALLLVLLVILIVGWCFLSPEEPLTMTVENQDDTQYRLTAYVVPDADGAADVPIRATTEDGDRRYVAPSDLQSGAPYRNVIVEENEIRSQQLVVPPTGSISTTVEIYKSGSPMIYIVESTDGNESLIGIEFVTCEGDARDHHMIISDGFKTRWAATCS